MHEPLAAAVSGPIRPALLRSSLSSDVEDAAKERLLFPLAHNLLLAELNVFEMGDIQRLALLHPFHAHPVEPGRFVTRVDLKRTEWQQALSWPFGRGNLRAPADPCEPATA